MPCYHPIQACQSLFKKSDGLSIVTFDFKFLNHPRYSVIKLPCGRCIGCRLEYSRQWAIRCMHEAKMHKNNCFITLTFSDIGIIKRLSEDGVHPRSLHLPDFQKFMKRYRDFFGPGIRFYHCGEYGEICKQCGASKPYCKCLFFDKTIGRPHYHACIFNSDLPDRKFFKMNKGCRLDTSKVLQSLWPYGYSTVSDVTFSSAAYVARYMVKKINGKLQVPHYEYIDFDKDSGEVLDFCQRKPEYCTMSRRPGIATNWFESFGSDVYPSDQIVIPGRGISKPPRFYDNLYMFDNPEEFAMLKSLRKETGLKLVDNNTPERLVVREVVKLAKLRSLTREL